MTALTEARDTWHQQTHETLLVPVAAGATIYVGGMYNIDADGYAAAASDTADHKFGGVCEGVADANGVAQAGVSVCENSAGADGDLYILGRTVGRFRFACYETPQQDMLGAKAYVYDDQTVAICAWDVNNDVRCGHVTRLPATTLAIDPRADFASTEIEIQISGEPFDWTPGTTTTVAATTTTTAQA